MVLFASLLILWVQHDAVAQGDLARLEKYADRVELVVSTGTRSNLVSDSAARAMARWPGVVGVELRPPLLGTEAVQLRKIPRLAAVVPTAQVKDQSLDLLGPALMRTVPGAAMEKELERPCGNVRVVLLVGGQRRFEVNGRVDECAVRALDERAHAEGAPHSVAGVTAAPAPQPQALAAEPMGPAAMVFVDIDGEEPDGARYRELAKAQLYGHTLSGVSLPLDDGDPNHVLARAQLLPLAQLGKDVQWPACEGTKTAGLWKLVMAHDRPSKGKARLSTTLSFLRCTNWEPFADEEVDFKSVDLALAAAVAQVETVLKRGRAGSIQSP